MIIVDAQIIPKILFNVKKLNHLINLFIYIRDVVKELRIKKSKEREDKVNTIDNGKKVQKIIVIK